MIDKKAIINFCKEHGESQFYSPRTKLDYHLWPFEQLEKLNSENKVEEFVPGFIGFGSDGGNEMLAVNTKNGKIYMIPFIPMEEKGAVEIANDIDEFASFKTK